MPSKSTRQTTPALVVTETPAAAVLEPLDFSPPLLHESVGGDIEWVLPDPSKPDRASFSAELWRGTGDSTEDVASQTVPCYQVRLGLHVGGRAGTVDTTFQEIAVPMHGGLKALAKLLLELYARTERLNLPSFGWDRDEDEPGLGKWTATGGLAE